MTLYYSCSHIYVLKTVIILYFFSDIYPNRYEISGPFLRPRQNEVLECYSIHSLAESNKQPLQKSRYDKDGKY